MTTITRDSQTRKAGHRLLADAVAATYRIELADIDVIHITSFFVHVTTTVDGETTCVKYRRPTWMEAAA